MTTLSSCSKCHTSHRDGDRCCDRFLSCYSCGQSGHTSRRCKIAASRNIRKPFVNSPEKVESDPSPVFGKTCNYCKETGHFSKECPQIASKTCDHCKASGHLFNKCPIRCSGVEICSSLTGGLIKVYPPTVINVDPPLSSTSEVGKFNDTNVPNTIACHNCLQIGHMARHCKSPKVYGVICDNCKQVGHIKRRCPYPIVIKDKWYGYSNVDDVKVNCPQQSETVTVNVMSIPTPPVLPSTIHLLEIDRLHKQLQTAQLKIEEVLDEKLCIICQDEPISFCILPCAHYKYCKNCIATITECSICRGEIKERKQIF
jgi:hypothetical protein